MRSVNPLFFPAFSNPFSAEQVVRVVHHIPTSDNIRNWAISGATGKGVKVAIIDSGVDGDHPDVGGVQGYASVNVDGDQVTIDERPHEDLYGHGTACAGIIRKLAPECEIYSVRVLGSKLSGSFQALMHGMKWAVDHGMQVSNLSLGTTKKEFVAVLHELSDRAYFRNAVLVVAANNLPMPSYPSMFASVISVASHAKPDSELIYCNAKPPVEFGAFGVNIEVAWLNKARATVTGNSYATPHVTGMVARMLSKHPGLNPAEVKVLLRAISDNADSSPEHIDA